MVPPYLSKTNFLKGLQCHKYLWKVLYAPEEVPPPDEATRFLFDQGYKVGNLAKQLFPAGIDIPTDDFAASIRITNEMLLGRIPLFEASILSGNIFSRIDVLQPADMDAWDIIEVKNASSTKDVNMFDIAFQRLCCHQAGLKIRRCKLAYINSKYVRHGEIDPTQLFLIEDVSDRVEAVSKELESTVEQVLSVMAMKQCPEVTIGPHCDDPYECPLHDNCWSLLPEHSVFNLYYGGKKRFDLYESGIKEIKDIPADYMSNDKQRIQQGCVISGKPHIDRENVRRFLASLQYPVYYLDFETFSTAIPLFDGTCPYQQIPFQFSLHVMKDEKSEPEHFMYLDEGKGDPRPQLAHELKHLLGDHGSIVAYYLSFEQKILSELAEALPDYKDWVEGLQGRMLDLYNPFKSFHYYHPLQKGSASLKSVLPAVTGVGYDDLPINNGKQAGVAFLSLAFGDSNMVNGQMVRDWLREYCKQDTYGMVLIVSRLYEAII